MNSKLLINQIYAHYNNCKHCTTKQIE